MELSGKFEALTPEKLANANFPKGLNPDNVTQGPVQKLDPAKDLAKAPPKTKTKAPKKNIPAASPAPTPTPAALADEIPEWTPAAWPYGIGEKSVWAIRYGLIEGGVATLSVEEPVVLEGEPVIHYRGNIESSRLLELFYKVNNQIDSWIRLRDHIPLRQEVRQLESSRWGRRVVVFDPAHHKAKFFQNLTLSDGKKEDTLREDDVAPFSQDIFGALFFVRFLDLNHRANFSIHDRWKNWNNELTFVGEESIQVPAGTFEARRFKMLPRVTGALEPKGDVEIWLWKHPSNLILKFDAKIKVGTITGELRSYTPGRPITMPLPRMRTPTNLTSEGALPKAR